MTALSGAMGLRAIKEGDGCTPVGRFRYAHFGDAQTGRRALAQKHAANVRDIQPNDGWSDDPRDPNYNRLITRPHRFRHERLWRDDGHYDVIIRLAIMTTHRRKGAAVRYFFTSPAQICHRLRAVLR